jgi:hypothetical protein
VIYLFWWVFIIYYYFLKPPPTQPTCDFSPILFIYLTPIAGVLYSVIFLIKSLTSKKTLSRDYLIFIGIVILPLIIGGLYVMGNS